MAKDPAFLFYYQDFLVGTSFMTLDEIGAYIKLLCFQADKKRLSENDILKKIPKEIWETISCKFKQDKLGFFNVRLEQELIKRKDYTDSRSRNRLQNKDLSKNKRNNICKSYDKHMENENEDINEDKDIDKKDIKEISKKFKEFVFLTDSEYLKLIDKLGKSKTEEFIERLNNYIGSKGKKYKSHYHTILSWSSKDGVTEQVPDFVKRLRGDK